MVALTNIVKKTSNGDIVNLQTLIKGIFPEYGTFALDIPYYDSDKHMYIVDQYTSDSGNRRVTYVAVSRQLCVEVTLTMFHSWTLMSAIRVMIPNIESLKVVKTYEWPQTTYFNLLKLCEKIRDLAVEFAADNLHDLTEDEEKQLSEFVDSLIGNLLRDDIDAHLQSGCDEILAAYCKQMKVCKDFVTF
ncbi:MAG: hypothetical protein J6R30_04775 [Bacteroidales bacterium]|jgi:hypothetical protein|nr:hypothetical protein [Bacteroidales bacterium]